MLLLPICKSSFPFSRVIYSYFILPRCFHFFSHCVQWWWIILSCLSLFFQFSTCVSWPYHSSIISFRCPFRRCVLGFLALANGRKLVTNLHVHVSSQKNLRTEFLVCNWFSFGWTWTFRMELITLGLSVAAAEIFLVIS